MKNTSLLFDEAVSLLQSLIAYPSFSKQEDQTAKLLYSFFDKKGIPVNRLKNNIWVKNKYWDTDKPVLLLNSHHDTVKPVSTWSRDPFTPTIEDGKLFGLGSNDAGASLVALIACFLFYYEQANLPYNLLLAASAEEEISGSNGIAALLPELGGIDLAIVGEPTQLRMAIAEKGLMVIDGTAKGEAGHAARNEGVNALYIAMEDIAQLKNYQFDKTSKVLGESQLQVTQILAGQQHNVIPDQCSFVIDVRTNEHYSNKEVFNTLQAITLSELKARSFRLNSSGIEIDHPIIQKGQKMGIDIFGSPTLSDQALMSCRSVKIGCGKSSRSHTADEYIYLSEIQSGIDTYIELINQLNLYYPTL